MACKIQNFCFKVEQVKKRIQKTNRFDLKYMYLYKTLPF